MVLGDISHGYGIAQQRGTLIHWRGHPDVLAVLVSVPEQLRTAGFAVREYMVCMVQCVSCRGLLPCYVGRRTSPLYTGP